MPEKSLSAKELMLRIAQGDEDAFQQLVLQYQDRFLERAYAKVSDFHTAQDIVQETFLAIREHASSFGPPYHFWGWSDTILRNLCIDVIRARDSQRAIHFNEYAEGEHENGGSADPKNLLERAEQMTILSRNIRHLSPKQREVMLEHCGAVQTQREIGEKLGITADAVNTRSVNARRRLRQYCSESNPSLEQDVLDFG